MQASLKYLTLNIKVEEKNTFVKEIKGIRTKLQGFKVTCKTLQKLACEVSAIKICFSFLMSYFSVG